MIKLILYQSMKYMLMINFLLLFVCCHGIFLMGMKYILCINVL